MTAMRWAASLFWDDEADQPSGTRVPPMASAIRGDGHRAPRAATTGLRALVNVPRVLARELRPTATVGPFRGTVGRRRQVALARCPLDDLRRIERSAGPGVTMNDVLLAAITGAIRRWSGEHGTHVDHVRVKVPVSLHGIGGRDEPGNKDSFLFVDLPVGEPDPARRLFAVNRETRQRKAHHDAETLYATLEDLRRLAPPLATAAGRLLMNPREFAVNVSNVPGPKNPVTMLGRPVQELYSVAEVAPHHPLRIAAASLAGAMHFGLCADPDLVVGLETLAAGIEASVAELAAAS